FPAHGLGRPDPLLDPLAEYESLAKTPITRRRRWSAFVHQTPSDEELAAIRRSCSSGLLFGTSTWVDRLATRLGLDLTIRPRGRPRKTPTAAE
ncbi:MAG TPA: hypothetical protein VKE74_20750, partial [Gemmataceae bacterium]|nr:hypothetical protein [Gemmataceae bacterium]